MRLESRLVTSYSSNRCRIRSARVPMPQFRQPLTRCCEHVAYSFSLPFMHFNVFNAIVHYIENHYHYRVSTILRLGHNSFIPHASGHCRQHCRHKQGCLEHRSHRSIRILCGSAAILTQAKYFQGMRMDDEAVLPCHFAHPELIRRFNFYGFAAMFTHQMMVMRVIFA